MPKSSREAATPKAILPRLPECLSAQLFAGATSRHLDAGERLFVAGDSGDGCYLLERGLLKVIIASPQGEERTLSFIGPGAIAGELAIIDRHPRSASITAVRDCELRFISLEQFEEYAQQNPEIYRYLVNVLAARLRETDDTMAAAVFLTIKARLARALLELAEHLGEDDGAGRLVIRHRINQYDLAAMAGVARENVSRALSDWKRHKLVTRSSAYYCINDMAALKHQMDS